MSVDPVEMLEAARIGKEVGHLVALVLIASEGDSEKAMTLCGEMSKLAPVIHENELDVCLIAQQAIREAVANHEGTGPSVYPGGDRT
jgi:hypothetical protein